MAFFNGWNNILGVIQFVKKGGRLLTFSIAFIKYLFCYSFWPRKVMGALVFIMGIPRWDHNGK